MIVFKKFGKTIKIRNDHWKKLRARFDPENAVLGDDGCYDIERDCPFCDMYLDVECSGCPFEPFGRTGCIDFIDMVFPKGQLFESGDCTLVWWEEYYDKKARRQLNRLQKMMDKIEAEQ